MGLFESNLIELNLDHEGEKFNAPGLIVARTVDAGNNYHLI